MDIIKGFDSFLMGCGNRITYRKVIGAILQNIVPKAFTYTTRSASLELILRNTFPHRTGRAHTTSNHLQHIIHIVRSAPLLMSDHVDLAFHLGLLHQLPVRAHTVLGEGFGELIADERGGVQAGKGDELPAVA